MKFFLEKFTKNGLQIALQPLALIMVVPRGVEPRFPA
jgi:hypothetical protein